MRQCTLCILTKGEGDSRQILLAMKKKGFGMGKFNGVGGKVRGSENESVEGALVREAQEEIGVDLENYEKMAVLDFIFAGAVPKPEWNQQVHVYLSTKWGGEPTESEEMRPEWFFLKDIPYGSMWEDDRYWLPMILSNKKVKGRFVFGGENGDKLENFEMKEVSDWE